MTKLSTRFLFSFAIAYLVLIGLLGIVVDRSMHDALVEGVEEDLAVVASLSWESLPANPADYDAWAGAVFTATGYRTTVIRTDGVVLADSHLDPTLMENHATRVEVVMAMTGEIGVSDRVSASTGFEQLYVALPPRDDLIVRLSVPTRVIDDRLIPLRWTIILGAVTVGLVGMVLVLVLTRRMARPITQLTDRANALIDGDAEVSAPHSRIRELDLLGLAVSRLADRWGARVSDAEEARETLEVVLGALPQGTILVGPDDVVAYANPSAYGILGAVPDQLGGLAPLQFQNAVREARNSRDQVVRVLDHGSPTRRLRGVATPFAGDDRVLLLVVDITERERTDSIRRDFVANASHELKTPVATIIASSEALQIALERRDETAAAFAGRIEDSARQLDRLVGDLLDLSRLEKESPDMTRVRLDLLVRDEVERIRHVAEEGELDFDVDVEAITVMGGHRDIAVAVRNLLDNAMRYTMAGGRVMVAVRRDGDAALVSIADTGEGIPTRDIDRVFERFYRVDSARSRATGGTGLGLSIVKHVAESHGGSVSVESELGVGSTFTIRLPIGSETAPTSDN